MLPQDKNNAIFQADPDTGKSDMVLPTSEAALATAPAETNIDTGLSPALIAAAHNALGDFHEGRAKAQERRALGNMAVIGRFNPENRDLI